MEKGKKYWLYKGGMIIYDIIAVNFAYWFALIARFFIGNTFRAGAEKYMATLSHIAPLYTVACIVIFFLFNLYNTLWKIAGIRDLNRILLANIATTAAFVVGSLVTGNRMPLTIYFIGPAFQIALIGASRMGLKLVLMERDHMRRKDSAAINAMIIGIRSVGQNARRQIDQNEAMQTKCIVDTENAEKGFMADGIPVIGSDGIVDAIHKYSINYVMIADTFLSDSKRQEIRKLCEEQQIEVADMTGYIENGTDALSLVSLLHAVDGPVTLTVNGKERTFANGESAMLSITKRYIVKKVSSSNGGLKIALSENPLIPNDTTEDWVNEYKEETGSEVSFF